MGRKSPVKVEYTLTPEDYAAAVHEHVQILYGKPRWARYRGMAALFLVFLSQGAMLVALGLPWPVVAGVLLLGVLFFVLLPPLIFKRQMAGVFRRARLPVTSMRLEGRPEGPAVPTATTASLAIRGGNYRIAVRRPPSLSFC